MKDERLSWSGLALLGVVMWIGIAIGYAFAKGL